MNSDLTQNLVLYKLLTWHQSTIDSCMAPSLKNILAEACKKAGYIKELLYFFRRMQKLDIFYDGIKMAMSGHSPVGNVF